jgi:alpha-beta hydrolase superfamily lysophospholipase
VFEAPNGPAREPALEDEKLIASDGTALPLRIWKPAGPVWAAAVALHGYNDYSMAFSETGTELAERGIATYAYDQRGFGGAAGFRYWHGTDRMVADFRAAVALVRARHPGLPVYAIGESMGGAVVLVAGGGGADGAVLIAPAVWGASTMPFYQSATLHVLTHMMPWWRISGAGLPIQPSDNRAALRRLAADPLVIKDTRLDSVFGLVRLMDEALEAAPKLKGPALVLYGKDDDIVPRPPTCRMIRTLPPAPAGKWRIVLYPEGHHMLTRDLAGRQVIGDIAAFFAAPDRPVPSHAEIDRAEAGRAPPQRAEALCMKE